MSAASVVVEGATSPAFFHLSGPGSDLAIGTVIIALLVACAALSNQEWSWIFRRQKAWRRSNSCEALVQLGNSAALSAATEMFESFEERSGVGPTSPRIKKSPSMPVLRETEDENSMSPSPSKPAVAAIPVVSRSFVHRRAPSAPDAPSAPLMAPVSQSQGQEHIVPLKTPQPQPISVPPVSGTPSWRSTCLNESSDAKAQPLRPQPLRPQPGARPPLAHDDAAAVSAGTGGGFCSGGSAAVLTKAALAVEDAVAAPHFSPERPLPRLHVTVPSPRRVAVDLATLEDHAACDEADARLRASSDEGSAATPDEACADRDSATGDQSSSSGSEELDAHA